MTRNNDHNLTLRLPSRLYDELKARAEEDDRTVAWLLRRLAREYLDETKAGPRTGRVRPRRVVG